MSNLKQLKVATSKAAWKTRSLTNVANAYYQVKTIMSRSLCLVK